MATTPYGAIRISGTDSKAGDLIEFGYSSDGGATFNPLGTTTSYASPINGAVRYSFETGLPTGNYTFYTFNGGSGTLSSFTVTNEGGSTTSTFPGANGGSFSYAVTDVPRTYGAITISGTDSKAGDLIEFGYSSDGGATFNPLGTTTSYASPINGAIRYAFQTELPVGNYTFYAFNGGTGTLSSFTVTNEGGSTASTFPGTNGGSFNYAVSDVPNTYGAITISGTDSKAGDLIMFGYSSDGGATFSPLGTATSYASPINGAIQYKFQTELPAGTYTFYAFNGGTGTLSTFTVASQGNSTTSTFPGANGGSFSYAVVADPPCFCRGTLIRTEQGEVPVEALAIGDRILTVSGAARPIRWIGTRRYAGRFLRSNPGILPILIEAGALGSGLPIRDLLISPKHAMFLDGLLVPAECLVNDTTIRQLRQADAVEYFHVELDTHDVLLAEGAASETFVDDGGRGVFHNAAEYAALYPEVEPVTTMYCATRVTDGEAVYAIRRRLAALARARETAYA